MRTRTQIRPLGTDLETDHVLAQAQKVNNELEFFDSPDIGVKQTTRGVTWYLKRRSFAGAQTAGGAAQQFIVVTENVQTLTCTPVGGGTAVTILKPITLQNNAITVRTEYGLVITSTPLVIGSLTSPNKRTSQITSTAGLPSYHEVIFPAYVSTTAGLNPAPNTIWAAPIASSSGALWIDLNNDGRAWCKETSVCTSAIVNGVQVLTSSIALIPSSGVYTTPISFSSI